MIKKAAIEDSKIVAELALKLWSSHEISDMEKEMINYINSYNGAVFIYKKKTEHGLYLEDGWMLINQ